METDAKKQTLENVQIRKNKCYKLEQIQCAVQQKTDFCMYLLYVRVGGGGQNIPVQLVTETKVKVLANETVKQELTNVTENPIQRTKTTFKLQKNQVPLMHHTRIMQIRLTSIIILVEVKSTTQNKKKQKKNTKSRN